MRKVIFCYWVPAKPIDPTIPAHHGGKYADETKKTIIYPNIKPGTNCFSEPQSGYFHAWGVETEDRSEDTVSNTVAIIEHCTTGHIHTAVPKDVRFVQPPPEAMQPLSKSVIQSVYKDDGVTVSGNFMAGWGLHGEQAVFVPIDENMKEDKFINQIGIS